MALMVAVCAGIALASFSLWYGQMESLWLLRWEFMGGDYQGSYLELTSAVVRDIVTELGRLVWRWARETKVGQSTSKRLSDAGHPAHVTAAELWGWRLIFGFGAGIAIFFLERNFGLAAMAALLSSGLPYVWLSIQTKKRETAIHKALPGALDLLVICTGAGLSFDAAVGVMVEKSRPSPLMDEFRQVLHHMRMGRSRQEALRLMAERCKQPDIRSVCTTLIHADQLGTSISSTLLLLAEQIRVNQAHRAEAKANRAPVQMLFPLIFFIFPSLLLVLFGPVFLGGSF